MNGNEIPQQWVKTTLGHIVDYGRSAKKTLVDVNDNTWVLELEDIEKDSSKLLSKVKASDRKFKSTKNTFHQGDVLYGKLRPYLNKVIMADEDGVCTTEIIPINAEPFCINRYIFFWLKNPIFLRYVREVSYGVNMPRLGTNDGKSAPFYLAPLAEQKIIADKLDDLLARVESIKIRLENIPEILKKFRQSVLIAAVSGKLTEEWRQMKVETPLWSERKLSDIANIIDPHPSHRTPKSVEDGVPYIGIGDLKNDGSIDFLNSRKVSIEVLREHNERYVLKKGDFIFGKIGTLGKATSLPIGVDYTLSANVILIQPLIDIVLPQYLQYFLSSPDTMDEIARQSNSTSQSAFGIKKMRLFQCKLPSKEEQKEIIIFIEKYFSHIDSIECKATDALALIGNLTQSILAKAFRGELTAQWREENPELISGINSAEALLEKITAEKLAAGAVKKRAKKTSH